MNDINLMFLPSFYFADKPECIKKDPVTLGVVTQRDAEVNYHINEPSHKYDFCNHNIICDYQSEVLFSILKN